MQILILVVLVLLSGLFSGLNIGLLSLSLSELKIEKKLGNPYATRILPLRQDRNLLIATLILGNVIVNAIIPLFLNSLTTGLLAGIISVGLITLFGEVLPQALCVHNALRIGGFFTPFVWLTIILTYPLSKPLALLLNSILGREQDRYYSKRKMERFVELHSHPSSNIDQDEIRILKGTLTFSDKTVQNIMTPWRKVFYLRSTDRLSASRLSSIQSKGHSRIPVVGKNKNDLRGILYMKELLDLPKGSSVSKAMRTDALFFTTPEETLDDLLNLAIRQHLHLFIVRDSNQRTVGIITLEDIVEEILRREIEDETD